MGPDKKGGEGAGVTYIVTYSHSTRTVLYCVAAASLFLWFAAVAVHTHLNGSLSSMLVSIPLMGRIFRGDYKVAITGISSMVVLLAAVFAIRLEADIDGAVFDALLLGSVLTLVYEYWVWKFQTGWFSGRFTILTGAGNYLGFGLTNQFVAGVAVSLIVIWVARKIWLMVEKPRRRTA